MPKALTSLAGNDFTNNPYAYMETDYYGFDFAEYESVLAEMRDERAGESEYGTCYFCGEWKPRGYCPKGH